MAAIHRDVHIHSTYSFDGKSPVRAYIDRARELGLREICITDHQELQIHTRQYRPYDGDGYYAEMIRLREECREFLDLRLGTELGILSDRVEEARRRAKAYPYDFIILSAHWCDGSPNFYSEPWGSYTNRDVFTLHLRRQLEYARIMEDFDVLGHITYYSRRSPYRDKEFRYTDAPELLAALFQTLIETEMCIRDRHIGSAETGCPDPSESACRLWHIGWLWHNPSVSAPAAPLPLSLLLSSKSNG